MKTLLTIMLAMSMTLALAQKSNVNTLLYSDGSRMVDSVGNFLMIADSKLNDEEKKSISLWVKDGYAGIYTGAIVFGNHWTAYFDGMTQKWTTVKERMPRRKRNILATALVLQ